MPWPRNGRWPSSTSRTWPGCCGAPGPDPPNKKPISSVLRPSGTEKKSSRKDRWPCPPCPPDWAIPSLKSRGSPRAMREDASLRISPISLARRTGSGSSAPTAAAKRRSLAVSQAGLNPTGEGSPSDRRSRSDSFPRKTSCRMRAFGSSTLSGRRPNTSVRPRDWSVLPPCAKDSFSIPRCSMRPSESSPAEKKGAFVF